jgi:thioredoxin reductase
MTQNEQDQYDVVVIGGGAAGLGAALMLARSRRSVAVVDGGKPRNAPAAGVHGYLTRDGMPPAELVRTGRIEVEGYGGRVLDGQVERVHRNSDERLTVTLADGRTLNCRRLLVATGLVDELPDVPGVQERWGRDVLHCPYCHGWEVRDQAIAVLGSGPQSAHQALLFRQFSDDVTYLSHSLSPTAEQQEQLRARGIRIVEGPVAGLQVENDRLAGVRLADGGGVVPCTTLVVATYMRARTDFLAGLGLAPVEHPFGVGQHLAADPQGRTEAPGVWVAGNVTDLSAQVGAEAAAGALAGAQINGDLALEDTRVAVDALRADASPSTGLAPVAQLTGSR